MNLLAKQLSSHAVLHTVMTERKGMGHRYGLQGVLVQNHPCMHIPTGVPIDDHVNHTPELAFLLKGWGGSTEMLEDGRDRVGLRNHQTILLNFSDLKRTPVLDDTIVTQRNPVLFTGGLGRRTNDRTLHAGLIAKDHAIRIRLREFLGRCSKLTIADPNVFQTPNGVLPTRKIGVRHQNQFAEVLCLGILLAGVIKGIHKAIVRNVPTLIRNRVVHRADIQASIGLNGNRT